MRNVPVAILVGLLGASLTSAGCSGGSQTFEKDVGPGEVADARLDPDIPVDLAVAEVGPETTSEGRSQEIPDIEAGELADLGPEPGGFGYPCQTGSGCNSGICMTTPDGGKCTIPCEGECPAGWGCALHKPSLPDEVWVCAPLHMNLCKPCRKDGDCETNGVDLGDRCIPSGAAGVGAGLDLPPGALGAFCGGACASDGQCPGGYVCLAAGKEEDAEQKQCVPETGECACAAWFTAEGASTDCFVANEWGQCSGERFCSDEGLTPCDALIPKAEQCNGLDDDCDDAVDEGASGDACTIENQFGKCDGTTECQSGNPTCNAKEPEPEACDGKDNDCDDQVDEEYPDTDQDGTADCLETDKDGDGAPDVTDNCELVHNPAQEDFDLDSLGDACDLDDDDDKAADAADCQPLDSTVYPGAQEQCNGKDDDCDGSTDEELGSTTCGLGECLHSVANCLDGKPLVCDPMEGTSQEICNGKNDDCDGNTDEELGTSTCGLGECLHSVANCLDGKPLVCDPMEGTSQEICNGKDDDCDGSTDENLGTISCGKGVCKHSVFACADGKPVVCDPLEGASPEKCDNLDNDCNGQADEVFGFVSCGLGLCQHQILECVNGVLVECDPLAGAAPEECNGVDEDCDGVADNGLGTSTCGKGACIHEIPNCIDGKPGLCDPLVGALPEECDGIDNDCDGDTDEAGATGCKDYWKDLDQDQFGGGAPKCLCAPEGDYVVQSGGDCNDYDANTHVGAVDLCNNAADEDCDGIPNGTKLYKDCKSANLGCGGLASGQYEIKAGAGTTSVYCEMGYSGGGWTQMTGAWLDALQPGTYEYLYVANGAWYRSPETTEKWSWSAYSPVNGTYAYGKGADQTGTFGCTHGEQGYWGVGCSNCPGGCWKCFVHGAGLKDIATGQTTICQDQPNVFGYGACGQPVQIYMRKK